MTLDRRKITLLTDLEERGARMATKKKLMGFGKQREFLLHGFCFPLNTAGWELNWGFKEYSEGCEGVP